MDELEMLQRAKMYIDKLANGINPLDDSAVPEDDIVNNVRLSRCFFYVSDVLRQVIDGQGVLKVKKSPKEEFYISFDEIQKFELSTTPIALSEIAKRINSLAEKENMKKIGYRHISEWLVSVDMLNVETQPDGKTVKRPTTDGIKMGISTEVRNSARGPYNVVVYNATAQQFIVDNIEAIMDFMRNK